MEISIEELDEVGNATLALITDYITAYPDIPFEVLYKLAESEKKSLTATTKVEYYPGSEQDGMDTAEAGAEEGREFEALKQSWEAVIASSPTKDTLKDLISQTKAFQTKKHKAHMFPKRNGHRRKKKSSAMLDVLHTLLEILNNRSFSAEDGLWLAYLELLPCLLERVVADYTPDKTGRDTADRLDYEQLWRAAEVSENAREVVTPYLQGIIEPLEKELVFHFHPGVQTAQRGEPQHFFTFLLELLRRVDNSGAVSAASLSGVQNRVDLVDLGQLRLCLTAVAILSETYQWNPASASFLSDTSNYIVHMISSFLDFVQQAKGSVYSQTLEFLSAYVLETRAMRLYIDKGSLMVEKALQHGAVALWRRPFLNPGIESRPFYLNTLHFLRCVDAITRRLCSTLLCVDTAWRGGIVREFVESSIGTYVTFTEKHVAAWFEGDDDDNVNWNYVLQIQEVVLSLCSVITAADGWLDMLKSTETKGSCEQLAGCSTAVPSEPLDELEAHRKELIHKSAVVSKQLVKLMSRQSEVNQPNIGDYEDLEYLLDQLHRVPYGFLLLALEAVIKQKFEECLTIEEREFLQQYLSRFGLSRTSCLLR